MAEEDGKWKKKKVGAKSFVPYSSLGAPRLGPKAISTFGATQDFMENFKGQSQVTSARVS